MAVDGFTSIGLGVSTIIVGIVSEPSEKTDLLAENMPTSASNVVAKSADIVAGNENHEIENTVSGAMLGTSVLNSILKPSKNMVVRVLMWISNYADYLLLKKPDSSSNSNSDTDQDDKSQSDDKDDSDGK